MLHHVVLPEVSVLLLFPFSLHAVPESQVSLFVEARDGWRDDGGEGGVVLECDSE